MTERLGQGGQPTYRPVSVGTDTSPPKTEGKPQIDVVLPGGTAKIDVDVASDFSKLQSYLRGTGLVSQVKLTSVSQEIFNQVTSGALKPGSSLDLSGGGRPKLGGETGFKLSEPRTVKVNSELGTLGKVGQLTKEEKGQSVSPEKRMKPSFVKLKKEVKSEPEVTPKLEEGKTLRVSSETPTLQRKDSTPKLQIEPKPSELSGQTLQRKDSTPKLQTEPQLPQHSGEIPSLQSGPKNTEFRAFLPNDKSLDIPGDLLGKFMPLKKHLMSQGGLSDEAAKQLAGQINGAYGNKTLKLGGTFGVPKQVEKRVQEQVVVTMPWGKEMSFDKRIAQDPKALGTHLMEMRLQLPQGVKYFELAGKISEAIKTDAPLNFSEIKTTDNFLETGKLKSHSGEVYNPDPPERQSVVTSEIRGGSKSNEVYKSHSLPSPVYGGGWSKDLGPIVPEFTPGGIQVQGVGMQVSPECNNGGCKPYVVEWPNKQGFTLLIDVSHDAKEFKKDNIEHINLELKVGGKPLKLTPDGGNVIRVESPGRAQLALQIPKSELEKQFTGLVDGHDISVQPFYCDKDRKDFHINNPHLVSMPNMFGRTGELQRYEWPKDRVPVNTKTNIEGVSSPFVDPTAKFQTSMETESEFTFKVDSPQQGEKLITDSVSKFEKLALPKKTVLTPEEQEQYNKRLQTELGLPQSFFDGKSSWRIERKNDDYYYLDSQDKLSPSAKKIQETNPGLVEQFKNDVAPKREQLQSLGMGRPGIVRDTYLHVDKDGVVRQRGNFREDGTMSTKGAHRRDGEDSPFMVRYCRQVPCTKEAPIKDGVVGKPEDLKNLLYHDNISFQDALFQYPKDGDLSKVNVSAPKLQPEMQVESERYRYVLVHTELDEKKKPVGQDVMIELSFDISKGQMLDESGKPRGKSTTSYGFEFGLDHLGTSNDPQPESGGKKTEGTTEPPKVKETKLTESQTIPKEGSTLDTGVSKTEPKVTAPQEKVQVDGPTVQRDRHDRQDLTRDDLFSRPAYNVFKKAVKAFTPVVCGDNEIRIAGEKALTMKSELDGNTPPSGFKKHEDLFKS